MERKIYSENLEADKKYIEPSFLVKFVIIQEEVDSVTKTRVVYFRSAYDHSKVGERELRGGVNSIFVGAGSIKEGEVKWGSSACESWFGYDKPISPELLSELSEMVEQEFLELLN